MSSLRAPNINQVVISGYATADGDATETGGGTSVLKFSIGHNEVRKDKQTDEWKTKSHFFNIVAFGQLAERVAERLVKGAAVLIEGRLCQDRWETEEGQKRQVVKVIARRIQVLNKQETQEKPDAPPSDHDEELNRLDDIPF
jgi:single-strand DNA-binding protein